MRTTGIKQLSLILTLGATAAACASPIEDDSRASATAYVGAPPTSCSTDAQCGVSSICLVDRCAKVRDATLDARTRTATQITQAAQGGYTPSGELHVAYEGWGRGVGYTSFEGAFPVLSGGSAFQETNPFLLDHGPGLAPMVAGAYSAYNAGGVGFGGQGGPRIRNDERIDRFAVGRNAAGAMFVAMAVVSRPGGVAAVSCELRFAAKPPRGSWSPVESVAPCHGASFRDLGVHVRADGGADVVAAPAFGDLVVYRHEGFGAWSTNVLVAGGVTTRPAFVMAHGGDGTSHVVAEPYDFSLDVSRPDYTATYIELRDAGPSRSVALGAFPLQWLPPFRDLGVDAAGNVWIQKRTSAMTDTAAVVRVDPRGEIAERSLGSIATGTQQSSTLAVSPSGELALVHHAGGRWLAVRRFTPFR